MRIESGRMLNDYIQPNKKQYCIPVFQRDYAWTTEQCEKLFEDIVLAFKKDRLHFCGSFVYAPLPTKKHIDRYIIIDGQQRFTTLYILIKALADSATDEAEKAAIEKYLYNEDKFNRYGFDDKSKLKLKPVKTDNDQLQLLMTGELDKMNKSKDGIIYHNYMLFKDLIAAFLAEDSANSIMMIHDGIDNLICADIKLDHDDDAQEIFERINSTGIKLGLPDLIRNYVLMTDDDQERLYEEYWLVMQELLSKDRMESFFLDYANLEPHLGCEQGGIRPVLVVQNDVGNKHSKTIIVSALTSRTATKAKLPTHVFLDHIPGMYARIPSLVLLEQILTLDKSRLLGYIGSLSESQMKQVNTALKCSLEL